MGACSTGAQVTYGGPDLDPLQLLGYRRHLLRVELERVRLEMIDAVRQAQREGVPMGKIAEALGISRAGLHKMMRD